MEKSGPGHTPPEFALIIERPDLQSWPQRVVSTALTSVFWLVWVALWLPLITFAGWFLFGWNFRVEMIELGGFDGFFGLLKVYGVVIVILAATLLTWAKYNHLRFRGIDRRRAFPAVTTAMLAEYAGRDEATVDAWRELHGMIVEHDQTGRVTNVSPAPARAPRGDAATCAQSPAAMLDAA
jgi:biofilm PGA synthesis protein PgaD